MDNDECVAPGEASSSEHVVNMYLCSQAALKMKTEKKPPRKNDRYNLRSKGVPLTLGEA